MLRSVHSTACRHVAKWTVVLNKSLVTTWICINIKLEQLKAIHGMRVHLNDKVFKRCEKKKTYSLWPHRSAPIKKNHSTFNHSLGTHCRYSLLLMMLSLCNFLNPFLHSMIQPAATGPHRSCDGLASKRVESRWIKELGRWAIFVDNQYCKRCNFCIYWIEKGHISLQSEKRISGSWRGTYRNISLHDSSI